MFRLTAVLLVSLSAVGGTPCDDEPGLRVTLLGRLIGETPLARLQLGQAVGEAESELLLVEYDRTQKPWQAKLSWLEHRGDLFTKTPIASYDTGNPITVAREGRSVVAIGWPWIAEALITTPGAEPQTMEGCGKRLGDAMCVLRDGLFISAPDSSVWQCAFEAATAPRKSSTIWRVTDGGGPTPFLRGGWHGLGRFLAAYSPEDLLIGCSGRAVAEHGLVSLVTTSNVSVKWTYRSAPTASTTALHVMPDITGDGRPEVAVAYTRVGAEEGSLDGVVAVLDGSDGRPLWEREFGGGEFVRGMASLSTPQPLLALGVMNASRVELVDAETGAHIETITESEASTTLGKRLAVLTTDQGEVLVVSNESASVGAKLSGAIFLYSVSERD